MGHTHFWRRDKIDVTTIGHALRGEEYILTHWYCEVCGETRPTHADPLGIYEDFIERAVEDALDKYGGN